MTDVALPILSLDNDDVRVFATPIDAQRAIEPVDIEDGSVIFFDARGRRLSVNSVPERKYSFAVSPEDSAARLESALRSIFAALPSKQSAFSTRARDADRIELLVNLYVQLAGGASRPV